MKIAVIGVGAMGSIYAGRLAAAGHEVWAIDTWRAHLDAIAENGLTIDGPGGRGVFETVRTSSDVADVGPCDLYVIATKASAVGAAAAAIAPFCRPESLVLTIQNGLGSGERIAAHLPGAHVVVGVADGFGASVVGPGHVHHNAMKLIRIGELTGGMTDRLERLASVWTGAGFNVRPFADINQLVWEKFLCNVTFSAPCTVFGCTVGELMEEPARWAIGLGCMAEAHAMGVAKAVAFSFPEPVAYVTAFGAQMPGARPSMLLDHVARRPSEIDAINGMVPVMGDELGIPAPFNTAVTAAVRAREATFDKG